MKSKLVIYSSRILGFAVLLSACVGFTAYLVKGGIGSGQSELLLLVLFSYLIGTNILDKFGALKLRGE